MLQTYERHSRRKLIATALSVLVIAGMVVFADYIRNHTSELPFGADEVSGFSRSAVTKTSAPISTTASFKDGSYTASSDYYVPHSTESINVNLTMQGGVITDVSIRNSESDRESAQYQQDFASVYKSYVVGKKISDLQLGVIAGASDTTQGFDEALRQIATQAQA